MRTGEGTAGRDAHAAIASLHPGYAALVMATGVLSTGMHLLGRRTLSSVLLVLAVAAFAVLIVAYAWRAIAYPRRTAADARDPARAFGYFTLVAALNVLGLRLSLDGHWIACAVLAGVSVPLWLFLTYAIPGSMVMGHRSEPVLPRTNGSWFLWVVATQSLAAATATIARRRPDLADALAPTAVALWGVGVVLYLMLIGLVTVRLLDAPVTPHALSPTYWVYMGATAISVFAAAAILSVPPGPPVLAVIGHVVSGLGFILWAFGTWWIPLLLAFAVRRHLINGERVGYEPTMWSMVFPLGMYAAAGIDYGRVTRLDFMVDIARVGVWMGLAAWVAVAGGMVATLIRSPAGAARGESA